MVVGLGRRGRRSRLVSAAGEPVEHDRGAVRHDQPSPYQEHPGLAVADLGIVGPKQAGALRDQQRAAGHGVVDRLCNRGDRLPRQIGIETGHHGGRE